MTNKPIISMEKYLKNMKIMQATLIKSLDELVVGAYNILTVKERKSKNYKATRYRFYFSACCRTR